MLEARDLIVRRGGRVVLNGASLRVAKGEIAIVEGPSGGGKTTLLRALATLIAVDGGSLTLGGTSAWTLPPRAYRTRVAYVPQQPPMLEGSVEDNVGTGPRLRGIALSGSAVDALLDRGGLDSSFRARRAEELSGGEKQRVALARALANEPELLLLDEPTSALDPVSARHVLELARTLSRAGLGLVIVSHIQEHIEGLDGTRYVCEGGKLRPWQTAS